ncbi:MAG: glucose-6-phosphate isomerase, partial [Erythrobacter sp.]|nr:glucose-6-phosphate isomerase [Erythrobacter sp.]
MSESTSIAAAWEQLRALEPVSLAALFAADPARTESFTRRIEWPVEAGEAGMRIDFSKTHLSDEALTAFEALAEARGFGAAREALFDGGIVNVTEGRAATHGALRGSGTPAQVEEAEALLARMGMLVEAIHEGALGEVKHCIAIGIGGSALGPALA